MVLLRILTLTAFVGSNAYVQGFGIRSSPCPVASNICVAGNCHGTIPRISPSYRKSGSETSLKTSVTSFSTSTTPDFTQMLTYGVATGVQFGILSGALHSIDLVVAKSSLTKLPLPVVALLFVFLSLRSRIASPLDNSRPKKKELKGKATPPDIKRPSWTPPGIAFPFIWLTITALRGISSALVYDTVGGKLLSPPLLAMILHLSIGDTWNTITNLERRLGVSAIGVLAVWASVMNAIVRYYRVIPLAGKILAPSGVWISIATVLTMTIWRINKPVQPIWPVKGDGKSAKFKLSNLGQLRQPDSVEDSSEPTVERINEKVDLDSPKVATMEKLQAPSKKVYCRCWKSDTFPLCDGAHMKHNEATGDNVGPLIVTAKKEDK